MTDSNRAGTQPWLDAYGPGVSGEYQPLPDTDLAALVRRAAREHSSAPAFTVCLENGMTASLSFTEVDRASDAFAAWLRDEAGITPGERVALQAPNNLAFPVCAFGTFKAGAVLVNVNPLYTAHEMNHQLRDAGARVLVIIDMFADKLPEALRDTDVSRVVTLSIASFFPWLKSRLIRGMLRYIRREIPAMPMAVTPLEQAIAEGERGADALRAAPPRRGSDDTAVLQYTGGTTGVAKGAELTHGNLMANVAQTLTIAGPVLRPGKDIVLTALPMYHIFAFTFNMLTFFTTGCRNILCPSPRPPAKLRRAFEQFAVTKFSAVNALFQGLLREPWFRENPPRSIDLSVSGGTALHTHVAEEWERLVGSPICEGYGLSETSPVVAVNPPAGEVRLGTIGIPMPGTEVRLVDEDDEDVPLGVPGELVVRGPQVMRGYWQRPEETATAMRGGWFHTGDVARMDERGYFSIVDRKKDMIDVSGFNVYPNEVEDVLGAHPDIDEVAVVGVRDDEGDEHVHAFVVSGNPSLGEAEVRQWARRELTGYKVPERVFFRDELPKSPVGKILRKDLRKPGE
ncbi:long-chain-fatty-acid--CoA ligase [Arhodomonas aquaeolei]|uniref:long-chain-fatty-acid--CoA ligase n=1 Tax=Arhodomonas aquaeolei TaxID=2369 RepID=UPI000379CF18|nr:long-chain fatty acid--CoA ligase [Arhodomonas aquaeolei]